jgi:hypothetical protein
MSYLLDTTIPVSAQYLRAQADLSMNPMRTSQATDTIARMHTAQIVR